MSEAERSKGASEADAEKLAAPSQPVPPPAPPGIAMVMVLGLIALFSGLMVVLVYEYTAPIIAEKERLALEAAVFRVIPGVDPETATRTSLLLNEEGLKTLTDQDAGEANLYAVYDASKVLLGVAMTGSAQGYQDIVRTLFSYDANCACIVGMTVLKSTDTPGLGDKGTVEKNGKFMANFQRLDVSLLPDNSALAHPIETVKHGTKTEPWQVDAMSGATITSRAIANGMNNTVAELLPLMARHLDAIVSPR